MLLNISDGEDWAEYTNQRKHKFRWSNIEKLVHVRHKFEQVMQQIAAIEVAFPPIARNQRAPHNLEDDGKLTRIVISYATIRRG